MEEKLGPDTVRVSRLELPGIWAVVLIVGVALSLVAQFVLDGWADQSETAHWIQHGLLFWAGIMAGAGLFGLYLSGRRSA